MIRNGDEGWASALHLGEGDAESRATTTQHPNNDICKLSRFRYKIAEFLDLRKRLNSLPKTPITPRIVLKGREYALFSAQDLGILGRFNKTEGKQ